MTLLPVRPLVLASVLLLIVTGCASSRPPSEAVSAELEAAQAAIAQADQASAAQHAPLELRNARQKAQQARAALDAGDTETARRLSAEAAVDAELAQVKSRSVVSQAAVDEVRESIRVLREEIARSRRG